MAQPRSPGRPSQAAKPDFGKMSGGTHEPHEDKLPPQRPSTIKYNKLQKGPPEIKERQREREKGGQKPARVRLRSQHPRATLGQGEAGREAAEVLGAER